MPGPIDLTLEHHVRVAAFEWLRREVDKRGDVLPRSILASGFDYHGTQVHLVGPKGIFKPHLLALPLSITTAPDYPYDDELEREGYLAYRYRGHDPMHHDNVGLRQCMVHGLPLVYCFGVVPGKYMVIWPAYVVGDRPDALTFKIQVDDPAHARLPDEGVSELDEGRRRYLTSITRRRLHQRSFRERVLAAYRNSCAICRLQPDPDRLEWRYERFRGAA